jgi:hypothetical protein
VISPAASYITFTGKFFFFGVDEDFLFVVLFTRVLDIPIFACATLDVLFTASG